MRASAGVKNAYLKIPRSFLRTFCIAWAVCLCACSGGFETEPLVEYSTDVVVAGTRPQTLVRQLDAGVYLLEIRERDIDLRVGIENGRVRSELADAYLRHGLHRTVVSLPARTPLRITLASIDQSSWKGAAAVRILRWPKSAPDAPPDERLLGFQAQGTANALVARDDSAAWQSAQAALREAARHFDASNDTQSRAEAEYQRAWLERNLLFDFDASRRTAAVALADFRAAGDSLGMQRAAVLLGLDEISIAAGMGPDVPRAEHRALLAAAARRLRTALAFFEAHGLESDALATLGATPGDDVAASDPRPATAFEAMRRRARQRGDQFFEALAMRNLADLALRRGDVARAATLYESAVPLIERGRNPQLYAALCSGLGSALGARGEFDRALMLHTEALELFSARDDHRQTARELIALASIQFRSGNLERALSTLESALPLYETSHDQEGQVSALRLAGNSAAGLGRHDQAIEYLRQAEKLDRHGNSVDSTRVLIARELRHLDNLRGADELLGQVLNSDNEATRADALAERAQLRIRQQRHREALADLREADGIYGALGLDFDRIDSSSELALGLLDAGDFGGARAAADIGVELAQRIRLKAANPDVRARFLSASYTPYEARIEVELAAAPTDRDAIWRAFRTAETIRARSLADRLANGNPPVARRDGEAEELRQLLGSLHDELERVTRAGDGDEEERLDIRRRIDEARARLDARLLRQNAVQASPHGEITESRAAAQAALPEDTAVLAYFVGDRRSHAWLLTRRELHHATLPGRRLLEQHVAALIKRQRAHLAPEPDTVIAPSLKVLLAGVTARRLLVLPDGPLNGMPFAAVSLRGDSREQLIDRFVIASAPSLAVALREPRHATGPETLVAVVSDPVYTPDDRRLTVAASRASRFRGAEEVPRPLARLPYSAIEARAVTQAFAGARIIQLAGFDATARSVIALPSAELDVLHFATHAVIRKDEPEQSALFLSEFAADGSPLPADRLTIEDITRSGLRADVVVLSGCATGDGRELRGEGVLGLTYGFLANGSNTVVASLWPVEDALTARFMEEFYTAYRASGRAADALRTAQLRTRNKSGPTVWASFVVRSNGMP